jgi:stage II sporulation protein D
MKKIHDTKYITGILLCLALLFSVLLLLPAFFFALEFFKEHNNAASETSPMIKVIFPEGIKEIALEEFLIGVIAAEMPTSFPDAALEAQTIAARSYIYLNSLSNGGKRHEDAAVCCDSSHCQAWRGERERQEKWGENAAFYENNIRRAIKNTFGKILTYEGNIAQSPYFASCGGQTEASRSIWGGNQPWLQSVKCEWDKEAPPYESAATFTVAEAAAKLKVNADEIISMTMLDETVGGRVAHLRAGAKIYSGVEIRKILGLRSAVFKWVIDEGKITFAVKGYGHGVGMCQYGAGGMAKAGYSAENILKHYYQGIDVDKVY